MTYDQLLHAVQSSAGLRLRLRLQPLYGAGEIVFPCTVAGGKYQTFSRRLPEYKDYQVCEIDDGKERRLPLGAVPCVIIDSVQSQANRMEKALLDDIRAGNIHLPYIETDFTAVKGLEKEVGKLTCFDCPHRAFDAILRDSVDASGTAFPATDAGQRIVKANSANATALFQISPASLLFGSWDSTGLSGGLGEKFTRCVVSELVGVNFEQGVRVGTRVDPLNIAEKPVESIEQILRDTSDPMWSQLKKARDKFEKPSRINHSSVPWKHKDVGDKHGGVTVDYIQQSTTISFAALRLLHFPVGGKDCSGPALTVLAAMALHAAALNVEKGWHLRSRCDLVLDEGAEITWESLGGAVSAKQALPAAATRELLLAAIEGAKNAGLEWNAEPIRLVPSLALRKLLVGSQVAQKSSSAPE